VKRRALQATLVWALLTLLYLVPAPREDVYDSLPARFLPLSLLREGDVDLDEFHFLYDHVAPSRWSSGKGLPYYLRRHDGHVVSSFYPGVALLAIPVFAIPTWMGIAADSSEMRLLEHTAAATLAALAAVFLWQALRAVVAEGPAAFLAFVFAFGTSGFSIASRALWEHTGGQLCLAAALWAIAGRGGYPRSPGLAGLALGAAVLMRPTNALVVLPIALYVWWTARAHDRVSFTLLLSLPVAVLLGYNTLAFGGPWRSGRDLIVGARFWVTPLWEGIPGLLFSPGRGLLVYSPIFLLLPLAFRAAWRERNPLLVALWVATILLLPLCALRTAWWGGWCYGPRLLSDVAPLLVFLLYPVVREARPRSIFSLVLALLASVSVIGHTAGAFYYEGKQEARPNVDFHPSRIWKWQDSPLTLSLTAARDDFRYAHREREAAQAGLPTSRHPDAPLAARYEITLPLTEAMPDGSAVYASICATNSGRAVWIARTPDYRGMVRLGWRWWRGDEPLAEPWGRDDLPYNVFPRQQHCFRAWIETPVETGTYTLELGLVSEFMTWFSDRGVASVRVPYTRRR
jgi:hypothetical protein